MIPWPVGIALFLLGIVFGVAGVIWLVCTVVELAIKKVLVVDSRGLAEIAEAQLVPRIAGKAAI